MAASGRIIRGISSLIYRKGGKVYNDYFLLILFLVCVQGRDLTTTCSINYQRHPQLFSGIKLRILGV